MSNSAPRKPAGEGSSATWFSWAHDKLLSWANFRVKGGRLVKEGNSVTLIIDPPKDSSGGGDSPTWL